MLELKAIYKKFDNLSANENVSAKIEQGSIHGFVGENGAGKSVLMKILAGLHQADKGEIWLHEKKINITSATIARQFKIGMVHQHFSLCETLSVLDNIILGSEPITKWGVLQRSLALEKIKEIAGENLKLPWYEKVSHLTVGQKQKIEILKLLYQDCEILIFDEPTAVLTPFEVRAFFELLTSLQKKGKTILFVAHKISEILEICNFVTVLRAGKVITHSSTKELSAKQLVQFMVGYEVKEIKPTPLPQNFYSPNNLVLELKNISSVATPILNLQNLKLFAGEIVGIAGIEGNGQTALVDILLGQISFQGEIYFLNKKTNSLQLAKRPQAIAYISEDRVHQSIANTMTTEENSCIGVEQKAYRNGWLQEKQRKHWAMSLIQNWHIKCDNIKNAISTLSGGNQQKFVFGRELAGKAPRLLLACHPTRGVDIGSIEFLHQHLQTFCKNNGAVLLISSDLDELMSLSHRIYTIFNGSLNTEFFAKDQYSKSLIGQAMLSDHNNDSAQAKGF